MNEPRKSYGTADVAADSQYTDARAFPAEGARCGLVTCKKCGAALLLDPADTIDVLAIHKTSRCAGV